MLFQKKRVAFFISFFFAEFFHVNFQPFFWNAFNIPKSCARIVNFIYDEKK